MESRPDEYVPAAGRDWLLPLYDPVCHFVLRGRRFKERLVSRPHRPTGAVCSISAVERRRLP